MLVKKLEVEFTLFSGVSIISVEGFLSVNVR